MNVLCVDSNMTYPLKFGGNMAAKFEIKERKPAFIV
jgi:hypothetical protein